MTRTSGWWLLTACLLLMAPALQAALTIEITEGYEGAAPIAVVPFSELGAERPPEDVGAIVAADLRRSGRFEPLAERDLISRPDTGDKVNFSDWRLVGADNLVVGRVRALGEGRFEVRFQLFDVFRAKQLLGYSIPANAGNMRRVAHYIADLIYERLTGQPGAFDTRIAYVTERKGPDGKVYTLEVADSDGHNPQTVLRSKEPIMSPAWSPDGRHLAYVSFENNRAQVYVQDVATSQRRRVSSQEGVNGAPAWSPDGERLALTLSRDGNLEIYILDLGSGDLRRLTSNIAIDTEPAWSPDGASIVFTSDRSGGPQLYRVAAAGGRAERLTFEGSYNTRADFAPDGKSIALVHRTDAGFRIGVLDLERDVLRLVTDGPLDESPSFAPNGSMILYATGGGSRGELAAVSVDGRFRQRLAAQGGDVREPDWSPPPRRNR